jgi:PPP family 3-phenylpropionic acid transporter
MGPASVYVFAAVLALSGVVASIYGEGRFRKPVRTL